MHIIPWPNSVDQSDKSFLAANKHPAAFRLWTSAQRGLLSRPQPIQWTYAQERVLDMQKHRDWLVKCFFFYNNSLINTRNS